MQTIRDVAAMAGVSDKTVSRVVNGEPNVSAKTRERVEEAIAALEYIPNMGARLTRTNRSGVIGLITDVVSTTPNSVDIIRGIQDRISTEKQSLLIANTSGTREEEQRVWRTFQEHRIDGVLFATMYHRHITFDPPKPAMPTVLVNCTAEGRDDVPAVVPDDYQGGQAAAEFALDAGHRRIGFVTLNPLILAARLRGQAFEKTMQERGVTIRRDWIRSGYAGGVGEERICAFDVARDILSAPAADRPTVLLAGNDEIAMQCLFAAHALHLRVPDDVAIIGFDDFQKISAQVFPR
ncbi:LacI family DNA-binding transcriptional regulator [Sphingomonas aliaeris]|uniref:LacI family DNA-binding transcriptional regulator n=1 Tax=Sphingomonas aliaeris TaxID=2759526 RepID=A0A974NVH8_9SPHN|nr:LacI family DNA-binding transcriptional regulator [Sphingomonas aliaeris]QQV77640.1 LacI family DNA-binding transcriptional regulator [Sphingomonas aliaeris]